MTIFPVGRVSNATGARYSRPLCKAGLRIAGLWRTDHRSKEKHPKKESDMQSKPGLFTFSAITLAAAGLLFTPAANAQNQTPSPPLSTAPSPKAAPTNIPDKKLDAVAAAAKKVTAVKDSFEQKLATAPVADKERLIGEANNAITKAVTDEGLSIDEFRTILNVAQNDPVLRDKLMQRLK